MSVRLVAGRELSAELVAAWRAIRGTDVQLASPFFCPEFTSAVAFSKENVFVAVFEDDGVQALLPFETVGQVARPVGCLISDFQGLVTRPDYVADIRSAMQAGRLSAFDFDHVSSGQPSFTPYARGWVLSPPARITAQCSPPAALTGSPPPSVRGHDGLDTTRRGPDSGGPPGTIDLAMPPARRRRGSSPRGARPDGGGLA